MDSEKQEPLEKDWSEKLYKPEQVGDAARDKDLATRSKNRQGIAFPRPKSSQIS